MVRSPHIQRDGCSLAVDQAAADKGLIQRSCVSPDHPSTMIAVTVPAGIGPGGTFAFQTPEGNMMQVTCPPDAMEGQVIHVVVQPETMPAAVPAEACGGVHPALTAPQPQQMREYSHPAQPVAAVASSQQFTADQLKGCWFGCCVKEVRASALRNYPDALAHLCSPR